jgi:hypothetical protein
VGGIVPQSSTFRVDIDGRPSSFVTDMVAARRTLWSALAD